MTIEEAIEKAKEAGYKCESFEVIPENKSDKKYAEITTKMIQRMYIFPQILIDPLFWQCLGKGMGWCEVCYDCGGEVTRNNTKGSFPFIDAMGGVSWCPNSCETKNYMRGELYHWHSLIDHLADGGTIESFFEKL